MATLSLYKCRCGFEITTSSRFYYRIMSGYNVTRKCSVCKTIIHEHVCDYEVPHFETVEQFLQWIDKENFRVRYGRCPECNNWARLTLWSPTTNRCPKCRHALSLRLKNIMMVD